MAGSRDTNSPSIYQRTRRDKSITTAAHFVMGLEKKMKQISEWLETKGQVLPKTAVFCYSRRLSDDLIARNGGTKKYSVKLTDTLLDHLHIFENKFALQRLTPGASFAALSVEELYALGFRNFLLVGPAGHITMGEPSLNIGDVVLANAALPYEAVVPYYQSPLLYTDRYFAYVRSLGHIYAKGKLLPELEALAAKQNICIPRITVASTGAIYRETPHAIKEFTDRGATCIDMEVSGLYASVTAKKDAQVAAILYISDIVSAMHPSNTDKLSQRYNQWETRDTRPAKVRNAELLAGRLCLNLCGMHLAI